MTGEENHIPMLSRRNLNAIEDLDKRHKETHLKQKKEQFAKKLEEKFKVSLNNNSVNTFHAFHVDIRQIAGRLVTEDAD